MDKIEEAIKKILKESGFGEIIVKIQDGKIVFIEWQVKEKI